MHQSRRRLLAMKDWELSLRRISSGVKSVGDLVADDAAHRAVVDRCRVVSAVVQELQHPGRYDHVVPLWNVIRVGDCVRHVLTVSEYCNVLSPGRRVVRPCPSAVFLFENSKNVAQVGGLLVDAVLHPVGLDLLHESVVENPRGITDSLLAPCDLF